jgi:cytochrome c553
LKVQVKKSSFLSFWKKSMKTRPEKKVRKDIIQQCLYSLPACLLMITSNATADDLAYGEYLAGECVACHRVNSETAIPPINSLPAPYFIEALREYREGERDHKLMRSVARSLGDTEIEALAAYFEQLDN